MKNVKYERVYHFVHNLSTGIFSLLQGEKLWTFSFKIIKWMKKWKIEAGDNQFL
jgi:hypothetical protein